MLKFCKHPPVNKYLALFLFVFILPLCTSVRAQGGGAQVENCLNGIDDDGDGLVDLNDTADCSCTIPGAVRSLLPNPSFESFSADQAGCDSGQPTGLPDGVSQANCLTGWRQSSLGTTDAWNAVTLPGNAPLFPANIPQPLPSGAGVAGFFVGVSDRQDLRNGDGSTPRQYREYLGACLVNNERLEPGRDYRLSLQLGVIEPQVGEDSIVHSPTPVELAVYGIRNCEQLFFDSYECPETAGAAGWELIRTFSADGLPGTWRTLVVDFVPGADYQALAVGGSCAADLGPFPDYWRNYYFVDELRINVREEFEQPTLGPVQVRDAGNCGEGLSLVAREVSNVSYQWYRSGVAIAGATANVFTPPPGPDFSGSYRVRIESDFGCSVSEAVFVSPPLLTRDAVARNARFCQSLAGGITLAATTPAAASYRWSTGDTGPTTRITRGGTYTVTVTTACSETVETITASTAVTPTFQLVPDRVDGCVGDTIRVRVVTDDLFGRFVLGEPEPEGERSGANRMAEGPRLGPTRTTEVVLTETPQELVVSGVDNCDWVTQRLTLSAALPFDVLARRERLNCERTTGRITLELDDPEGVTYRWFPTVGPPVTTTVPVLDNITTADPIRVALSDGRRCPTELLIPFDFDEDYVIGMELTEPRCGGDAAARVVPVGGEAPYTIAWFRFGMAAPFLSGTDRATDLAAGDYVVQITDASGCRVERGFRVAALPPLTVAVSARTADCAVTNGGLANLSARGGTPPYRYEITGREQTTGRFTDLPPGDYQTSVTDANGCRASGPSFTLRSPTDFRVDAGPDQVIVLGDTTELVSVISDPDVAIISTEWSPPDGLFQPSRPTSFAAPRSFTAYTVRYRSLQGCIREDEVNIAVQSPQFYIPNAFSPNEDDRNDVFEVYLGPGVEEVLELNIYHRWGGHVWRYDAAAGQTAWDGTYNGEPLNPAVFVYTGRLRLRSGREVFVSGDLTLVR